MVAPGIPSTVVFTPGLHTAAHPSRWLSHACPPGPQSLALALLSLRNLSAPALRPGMSFELPRKPPLHNAGELEPSIPS